MHSSRRVKWATVRTVLYFIFNKGRACVTRRSKRKRGGGGNKFSLDHRVKKKRRDTVASIHKKERGKRARDASIVLVIKAPFNVEEGKGKKSSLPYTEEREEEGEESIAPLGGDGENT